MSNPFNRFPLPEGWGFQGYVTLPDSADTWELFVLTTSTEVPKAHTLVNFSQFLEQELRAMRSSARPIAEVLIGS